MKRLKRGVAWLMAICMLNMGGVCNGLAANAADGSTQSTAGYTLAFADASMDASGNGTVSVAVTVKADVSEVVLPSAVSGNAILEVASKDASGNVVSSDPAATVSADATYRITNVTALNVSGDALKVVGFAGAVPTLGSTVDLNTYYVKVASGNASSDAYQALASKFTGVNKDKLRVVADVNQGLLRVDNPTEYKQTLDELKNNIKVYDVLNETSTVQNPTITWYTDDTYTTKSTQTQCESGIVYYYEVTATNYNAYRSSVSVTSNAKVYQSGNCNLTLELTEASGNANGTATITKAAYIDGYTYNAADIYTIPSTVSIDGKTYTVTGIGSGAFGQDCCFASYYIPSSVKTIDSNAFYRVDSWNNNGQNQGASANSVLLLRFEATTADNLPEFSSQLQGNSSNVGFVFNQSIAESERNQFENTFKNDKKAGNNGSVYYVANPATDKVLKQGNVTPSSQKALYTDTLGVITLAAQGFKDFQTQAEVAVTAAWDEPTHPFSFEEGAAAFAYHCDATGYASYKGTITITPYAASGFTYRLVDGSLLAAGYDTTLTGATVVTVPDTETDATGSVYTVTGISSEFQNNTTLEEITLGANIATIQDMAFGGCQNMAIKVVDANATFKSVNGFLYSKDGTKLIAAPSARSEVFLPEGTLVIGNYAFYHNSKLQTLVIPASTLKIGEDKNARCFESCSNMDTIKFCNDNPVAMTITCGFDGALKNIYVPTGTTATYETLFKGYNIWYGNATFKEWTPTTSKIVTLNDYNEMEIAPTDTTKAYTWKSDNEAIVVVVPSSDTKSAKIHATAATGIATVTAVAADGTSTSWQVTVAIDASLTNPWAVPQYTLKASKSSVTMGVKSGKKADSAVITITASDKSAVTVQSAVSSNKKVATVSKSGNKITITSAAKKGTATITVTDKNGKTVKVKVTTKAAPKKVRLKKSSITLKKNKTYTIALKNTVSAKVTYKTSSKKVATVSADGVVTAKKKGRCKITVTAYNGKRTRLKVKVK